MAISKDWWDRWRELDFSWAGLARKEWQGYVVVERNGDEYVVEAKDGLRYGDPSRRLASMFAAQGEKIMLVDGTLVAPAAAERAFDVSAPLRNANLQDYWRADPETRRLRTIMEMAEELYLRGADGKAVTLSSMRFFSGQTGGPERREEKTGVAQPPPSGRLLPLRRGRKGTALICPPKPSTPCTSLMPGRMEWPPAKPIGVITPWTRFCAPASPRRGRRGFTFWTRLKVTITARSSMARFWAYLT